MKLPKMFRHRRGLGIIGVIIGILIVLVIAVALIPVIDTSLANSNITGTTRTLLDLTPLLVAIIIIVAILRAGKIIGKG